MRISGPRPKPLQREPIELSGGPGDGIVLFVKPPLPLVVDYPSPAADHRYRLRRDPTGWRYEYRVAVRVDV